VTLFGRVTLRREGRRTRTIPSCTGAYGFNDYRGLLHVPRTAAFGTTGDGQVTAFVEQGRRSSFSFNRRGVTTDYARRSATFTVTGRYTFDYTKLFDEQIAAEDQLLIDRIFPQVKLSKIFGGILRDSRDDVSIRSAARSSAWTVRWRRDSLAPKSASSRRSRRVLSIAACLGGAW
jgi:hypothetical protein